MIVEVEWAALQSEEDELGYSGRTLYAYQHPEEDEILYLGKAGSTSSANRRLSGGHKAGFFDDLWKQRRIDRFVHLVGELDYDGRYSEELLSDVESLLIMREQPWGNIQARTSRISRPGLIVRCSGEWPGQREYRDLG
jgi:hypothetical protein